MFQFTTIFLLLLLLKRPNSSESRVINSESDNIQESGDYVEFEDLVPIHENYRPKHKYKIGTGHRTRLTRSFPDAKQIHDLHCAVLYKNKEPAGILQPFEDAYRFFPIKREPTLVEIQPLQIKSQPQKTNDKSELNKSHTNKKRSNTATFLDENYPSVFTKFQLNNHLAKMRVQDSMKKKTLFKRLNTNSTNNSSTTGNDTFGNHKLVERGLQTVLEDMGLLSDTANEAENKEDAEDENLELGTNKINLINDSKSEDRGRRQPDDADTTIDVLLNDTDISTASKSSETNGIEGVGNTKLKNTKAVKRSSNDESDCISSNLKVNEYERRVEREIRDKIKMLQEEVIKEIDSIKKKEEEAKRKKRQVITTLLDEETHDIDPNYHNEDSNMIHVRKKRSAARYQKPDTDSLQRKAHKEEEVMYRTEGSSRRKRDLGEYQYDDEEALKNENENSNVVDEVDRRNDFASDVFNKDGCLCDRNTKYCECPNDFSRKLTNIDDDYNNDKQDNDSKTIVKKSILQECSCDKNGKNCKCDNNSDQNFDYDENENNDDKYVNKKSINPSCTCDKNGKNCKCYNENSNLIYDDNGNTDESKYLSKKSVKQSCTCDKSGKNCKCRNNLVNTIPSIQADYESDYDYKDASNEQNDNLNDQDLRSFSSNEDVAEDNYIDYSNSEDIQKRAIKPRKYVNEKTFQNGEYLVDLEPDVYKLEPIDNSRNKRENLNDLLAAEGNDNARRQLFAIRQRSMVPLARSRRRIFKEENNKKPRELINMSHEDLFGALPQSFDGELLRYKRVRRSKRKK
uniref:AP2/ERF domain-containing protein PFD0985w-like isoform X1 n=1 Tax=Diabrotica virgifera virgifera TaxID=50390 RepID=A0A6P7FY17_DIAVI